MSNSQDKGLHIAFAVPLLNGEPVAEVKPLYADENGRVGDAWWEAGPGGLQVDAVRVEPLKGGENLITEIWPPRKLMEGGKFCLMFGEGLRVRRYRMDGTGEWPAADESVNGECPDRVVEAVRRDLLDRSRVGMEKYGRGLTRTDLSLADWLQHAYEEALDLANYLKRAIMEVGGGIRPHEPTWVATHRHYKGGLYRLLFEGQIEADLSRVVVYQGIDGRVWVRPREEFYDGRFSEIVVAELPLRERR